jgi:hypothetical protein
MPASILEKKQAELDNLSKRVRIIEYEILVHGRITEIIKDIEDIRTNSSDSLYREIIERLIQEVLKPEPEPQPELQELIPVETVYQQISESEPLISEPVPVPEPLISEPVLQISEPVLQISESEQEPEPEPLISVQQELISVETTKQQVSESIQETNNSETNCKKRQRRTKAQITLDNFLAKVSEISELDSLYQVNREITEHYEKINTEVPSQLLDILTEKIDNLENPVVQQEPIVVQTEEPQLEPVEQEQTEIAEQTEEEPQPEQVDSAKSAENVEDITVDYLVRLLENNLSEEGLVQIINEINKFYWSRQVVIPQSIVEAIEENWTRLLEGEEDTINDVVEQTILETTVTETPANIYNQEDQNRVSNWLERASKLESQKELDQIWLEIRDSSIIPPMQLVNVLESYNFAEQQTDSEIIESINPVKTTWGSGSIKIQKSVSVIVR